MEYFGARLEMIAKKMIEYDQVLLATSDHDRTFLHSEHSHVLTYDTQSSYHVGWQRQLVYTK